MAVVIDPMRQAIEEEFILDVLKKYITYKTYYKLIKTIEDFMMQRMADNDKIVTRYMDDKDFQAAVFPLLAKEIFVALQKREKEI